MFNLNLSYNFTTLAPSILGADYRNMKVVGIMSMAQATQHDDVATKHQILKPVIPGLPLSAEGLTYIMFEDASGNSKILAENYIDPASVVAVTTTNLAINIFDVPSTTEAMLRQRLIELGVGNFTITNI